MNVKWLWILATVLIIGFSTVVDGRFRPPRPRPPQKRPPRGIDGCNVPLRLRRDCGYPGISVQTCVNRGCCFRRSGNRRVPWCFYRR